MFAVMKTKFWVRAVPAAALFAGCAATESGTGGPTATGVGGVTGAALGAAVGSAVGGKDGWWIGALSGAALGAGAGAAYSENERQSIPYGIRQGNYIKSPHSVARIRDNGYPPGQVVYDPNNGKAFRIP